MKLVNRVCSLILAALAAPLPLGRHQHRVGVSIGVAAIGPECGEIDGIIARADSACYAAKAAGRGRVSDAALNAETGSNAAPASMRAAS